MKKRINNEDGVWRTVGGRRIFIKNGQELDEEMIESGKFPSFKKKDKSIKEEPIKKDSRREPYKSKYESIKDVTEEWLSRKRPKRNKLKKDKSFIDKDHEHEIKVSKFLYDKFGGKMKLKQENYHTENIKYHDLKWNNKSWEIKKVSSLNAIDSQLRYALTQINKNGGVVLDISNDLLKENEILDKVSSRMNRSGNKVVVIVLRNTEEIIAILSK